MSRMDRYKKVHDESDKYEKKGKGFAVRKERQQPERPDDGEHIYYRSSENNDDQLQEPMKDNHYQNPEYYQFDQQYQQQNQQSKRGQAQYKQPSNEEEQVKYGFFSTKKKKAKASNNGGGSGQKPKKKSKSWKKRIGIILIIFLLLEIGSFFLGKFQAEADSSIPQQELQTFSGTADSSGAKNILLLGSDSREGETSRADTIMVVNLDNPSNQPKLISFMRDTYVNIPGYGYNKLNAAYAYGGADLVRQTLAENFGVETEYYAIVDFQSFEKVIDALFPSGIEIDAETSLELDGVTIEAGQQRMDGNTLLQYARFRHDAESDFGRVRRQQQVMSAIFSQVKNPLAILQMPYAAGKVMGYTSTNLAFTYLLTHIFTLANSASGIGTLSVPVDGSWSNGYYDDAGSVLEIDEATNYSAVQTFLNE
ncbi:LCP family protein [Enterococcus sp. LJL120]